ncbi:MAG: mechanosensitive ion channel family protein [Bacteriovoracaceae bacterium]
MVRIIFLLFLMMTSNSFAQETKADQELKSPRDTMKTFLTGMKRFKSGDQDAIFRVLKTLDLTKYDSHSKTDIGKSLAVKLVMVIDRIEKVSYEKIPLTSKSDTWTFKKKQYQTSKGLRDYSITLTRNKNGNWLFSRKTLTHIDDFFNMTRKDKVVEGVIEYKDWKTKILNSLHPSLQNKSFVLYNWQWLGLALLIFLCFLIKMITINYLVGIIGKIFSKSKIPLIGDVVNNFTTPIGVFSFLFFWTFGIKLFDLPPALFTVLYRISLVAFTVCGVFTVYRLVNLISYYFLGKAKETENKFDDILIPLMAKAINFLVIIIGAVIIGESLTIDMANIIAGLGIGGLAFAFAAKDTLANIFGSLTVLLDRPFSIGDAVSINGIEGAVEEVGLRSTRIRTWYNSLITIPNGQLTNISIDNYGKRSARRFRTHLGVQYDTPPDKIEAFCEGVRKIISQHPCTKKDNYQVYLNNMGASALEILLNIHFVVPDIATELQERHRLLMDIVRLAEDMEVDFAFPTQTLHVFQEQHKDKEDYIKGEIPHNIGQQKAQGIVEKQMTTRSPRVGEITPVNDSDRKL